jgi:hypothetical protein
MLYEYFNVFRVIPLTSKHPDDLIPSYMGNPIGRWEGDTLVVDSIGFNDKTWLAGTGTFHTEALHTVERFTRVDKDQINYAVTMEDPNVFTKPWTLNSTLMLRDGTRLQEMVCAENNIDPDRYEKLLKDGVKFTRSATKKAQNSRKHFHEFCACGCSSSRNRTSKRTAEFSGHTKSGVDRTTHCLRCVWILAYADCWSGCTPPRENRRTVVP